MSTEPEKPDELTIDFDPDKPQPCPHCERPAAKGHFCPDVYRTSLHKPGTKAPANPREPSMVQEQYERAGEWKRGHR